ncbi:MAG: DNA repair protein RadA [Bacteroidia bacterium]
MAKQRIVYTCSECGYKAVKWAGKCSSCNNWNTLVEGVEVKSTSSAKAQTVSKQDIVSRIHKRGNINAKAEIRVPTPDPELNRVLGGGIVSGSLILVGGKPGIGKSTLMLQLGLNWQGQKVLYFSGEESVNQINLRASRIEGKNDEIYFLADTSFEVLESAIEELEPDVLIIDSIQTLQKPEIESSPGSVVQIRECTNHLMQIGKQNDCSIFIIGHITKDGFIAGPKVLEHMVDVVLYFDDSHLSYRFIKSTKNRFGTTAEVGIYDMTSAGLNQVENPSNIFIDSFEQGKSGVAISPSLEGMRPMLIEIQALVSQTFYGTPQRTSTGFDAKRLAMLIAVLEKHCGLKLGQKDVFLNLTGGVKITDPSIDLAVIAALASSYFEMPIPKNVVLSGEVGLTGEVRPVRMLPERANECGRLGFKSFFHSERNDTLKSKMQSAKVENVGELIRKIFKPN